MTTLRFMTTDSYGTDYAGRVFTPGEWATVPPDTTLEGRFKLCLAHTVHKHLGAVLWLAEGRGAFWEYQPGVTMYPEARLIMRCHQWNEDTARTFALSIFEPFRAAYKDYNPQSGVIEWTVDTARKWLNWSAMQDASQNDTRLLTTAQAHLANGQAVSYAICHAGRLLLAKSMLGGSCPVARLVDVLSGLTRESSSMALPSYRDFETFMASELDRLVFAPRPRQRDNPIQLRIVK